MKIPVNPVALVGGLLVVAAGIGGVFYMQRGAHVELKGGVLKVRTQAMDEKSSVAVIDFRFVNPSNYPFMVKEVTVSIVDKMATKGIIHRNTAGRYKSRLASRMSKAGSSRASA